MTPLDLIDGSLSTAELILGAAVSLTIGTILCAVLLVMAICGMSGACREPEDDAEQMAATKKARVAD